MNRCFTSPSRFVSQITRGHPNILRGPTSYSYRNERWCLKEKKLQGRRASRGDGRRHHFYENQQRGRRPRQCVLIYYVHILKYLHVGRFFDTKVSSNVVNPLTSFCDITLPTLDPPSSFIVFGGYCTYINAYFGLALLYTFRKVNQCYPLGYQC